MTFGSVNWTDAVTLFPPISAIVVTYNSGAVVQRAIASLGPVSEIVCVDNASTDDGLSVPRDDRILLIQNRINVGFGTACNQAARAARGEFLLFLNPDAHLQPGCLAALSRAVDRYPDCSVFIPWTTTPNGEPWYRDRSRIEEWRTRGRRSRNRIDGDCCTRFVDGGVFLIRRELFLQLGGFDENIFLYHEDDDLSQRLIETGEPIVVVADAETVHDIGKSSPPTLRNNYLRHRAKKQSEIYLKRKYAIPYSRIRDGLVVSTRLFFYVATLQKQRAISAAARLAAIAQAS